MGGEIMFWIIETQNGIFEAEIKRKITDKITEYYGDSGCNPTIKAVDWVFKDGRTDEICRKGVAKIQEHLDDKIEQYRKDCDEYHEGQEDISRYYQLSIL